jgi:sugar lactone lactonase YvrE
MKDLVLVLAAVLLPLGHADAQSTTYRPETTAGLVADATRGAARNTLAPPTATVSGSATICAGQFVELRADLTGSGPWTVTWSDSFVDYGVGTSPSRHVVTPGSTATYTVTSVSDPNGPGAGTGSATVTVLPGPAPSAAITAPSPILPGTTGLAASVPDAGAGATYAWTISNGMIAAGQGSPAITFSVGSAGQAVLGVTVSVPGSCAATGATSVWVGTNPSTSLYLSRLAGPTGGGGWFDGPDATASILYPTAVAFDGGGNLYVLDLVSNSIRKRTPGGRFSTLAGLAGSRGSSDGRGSGARFWFPEAMAVSAAGTVFVADTFNNTIRKVAASGIVTTLAGKAGTVGIEDGTGSDARFYSPAGIAIDGTGNLFVADSGSHLIRKVTSEGVVTTVAGQPWSPGKEDGDVSVARFRSPAGLAFDADGNLYVADEGNHSIRRITPAGLVTTFAGAGHAGWVDGVGTGAYFRSPRGVTVDAAGVLYVADSGNFVIRQITPAREVTTLAGLALARGEADGTGSGARFNEPAGVAIGPTGDLFIADLKNHAIRAMTPSRSVSTVAGRASNLGSLDGAATTARFFYPTDVAAESSGSLVVADSSNGSIRRVGPTGDVTTLAGSLGLLGSVDGTGSAARFYDPIGIAVAASGDIYVTDDMDHTVRKVTPDGVVTTIAGYASYEGERDGTGRAARFHEPWGVATDAAGFLYVADSWNCTIRKISPTGAVTTLAGLAGAMGASDGTGTSARFRNPAGLAVDRAGNVLVADRGNATIRKISPLGVVTTLAGSPGGGGTADGPGSVARFLSPTGLRLDGSGDIWVTDGILLRKVTPDGVVSTVAGPRDNSPGAANGTGRAAQLGAPYGFAIRPSGEVALADLQNHSIWGGVPSLADEAKIDSASGSVGVARQLDAQPRTATTWLWEVVRTEAGSSSALSSTTIPNPTFVPDVPGYYRFRLTATDGAKKSVTLTSLFVDLPAPTAVVSGNGTVCPGGSVSARVELTGTSPWTIVWSDGEVWPSITNDAFSRYLDVSSSTTLSISSISDATGPGISSGSAVFEVLPKTPTPVIEAPAQTGSGSPNQRASVSAHAGSTYSWWVTSGTITSGAGTNEIVFTAGPTGTMTIHAMETTPGQCQSSIASATVEVLPPGAATFFYPLTPCRVLDTREFVGPTGGQPVDGGSSLAVPVGGVCGIPAAARAVAANVTATQTSAAGYLVAYPADEAKPVTSTVHFAPGRTRASNTQLKLSTTGFGAVVISNESPGPAHVILDVSGYYQ